jgi:hypothetical protein
MVAPSNPIVTAISGRLAGLRFPALFLLLAGVFLLDLFVPDLVPFVDEILLGVLTLIVGNLKRRRRPAAEGDG